MPEYVYLIATAVPLLLAAAALAQLRESYPRQWVTAKVTAKRGARLAALPFYYGFVWPLQRLGNAGPGRDFIRGRYDQRVSSVKHTPNAVPFGPLSVTRKDLADGVMVFGRRNAGKSTFARMLYRETLAYGDARGFVFDAKNEMLGYLRALGIPTANCYPFAPDAVAPDLAAYLTDSAVINTLADSLFPAPNNSGDNSKHFTESAARVAATVVRGFQEMGKQPTFRDWYCALSAGERRLRAVLSASKAGRRLVDSRFRDGDEFNSVLATIDTMCRHWEPLASAWHSATEAGRVIDVRAWADKATPQRVMLLGFDQAREKSTALCNQLLFAMATGSLMRPGKDANSPEAHTYFYLDELPRAGSFDGLRNFAEMSRSYGISIVAGAQSVPGLEAAYGSHTTAALVGALNLQVFLGLTCSTTASKAAEQVGEMECWQVMSRTEQLLGEDEDSETKARVRCPAVLASEFLAFPPANLTDGITGVWLYGPEAYRYTIPGDHFPPESTSGTAALNHSVPACPDWTMADLKRLGLENKAADINPTRRIRLVGGSAV